MTLLSRFFLMIIRVYQYLFSSFFGRSCRFHPTCSMYMKEAIEKKGLVAGVWLGLQRLGRCHPYHPGGYDPVPEPNNKNDKDKVK
jgi:hypothetical protein